MKKLMAMFITLLFATSATPEVYKWIDKDGKVHYGDEKTADVNKAEKVETTPDNTFSSKEAMTDEMRQALEESRRKRLAEEAAAKARAEEAKEKAAKKKAEEEAAEKARLAERKRRYGY